MLKNPEEDIYKVWTGTYILDLITVKYLFEGSFSVILHDIIFTRKTYLVDNKVEIASAESADR